MNEISSLEDRRATVISITADLGDDQTSQQPDKKRGCLHSKYCRKTLQPYIIIYFALSAYIFIGALVFQILEAPHHQDVTDRMEDLKLQLIRDSRNACFLDDGNWTAYIHNKIDAFEAELQEIFVQDASVKRGYTWDYFASCFFCLTVVSTIGYGHMTPATTAGRLLCLFYAVIGIPLYFLYLAKLGDLLAIPLRKLYKGGVISLRKIRLRRKLKRSYEFEDREHNDKAKKKTDKVQNEVVQEAIEDGLQPTAFDTDLSLLSYKQMVYRNDVCTQDEFESVRGRSRRLDRTNTIETISESIDTDRQDASSEMVVFGDINGDIYHSAMESMEDIRERVEIDDLFLDRCENVKNVGTQTDCVRFQTESFSDSDNETDECSRKQSERLQTRPLGFNNGDLPESCLKTAKFSPMKGRDEVPLSFLVVILVVYVCAGSAVFASSEQWTYIDAIYFCTITFTTVGFGDLIPVYNTQDPISQQALIAAFIITGMVIMSSCLSLSQDRIRSFGRKIFGRDDPHR
ncbi:potassium channel subfamily K member 18-like [Glandiceps talaboti]